MNFALLLLLLSTDELPVASITVTSNGQAIVAETVDVKTIRIELGQQIKLSSDKAIHAGLTNSLLWNVKPKTIQTELFPMGESLVLTAPTVATTISVQQIVTKNDAIAYEELIIICGKGPQPPPDGITPPVTPRKLFITLVSDVKTVGPDEANIRNSIAYWNKLKVAGHDWIFYDSLTPEGKGKTAVAAVKAANITFPALVFECDGKVLSIIALPKSTAEIDAEIKKLGGIQ
jgi:hypothetical protein